MQGTRREGRADAGAPEDARPAIDAPEIRESLAALAHPRMTGTAGARAVERELRSRFATAGYDVRELEFSFSTLPGRWGLPLAGVFLVVMAGAGWLLTTGRPGLALTALLVGLAAATLPLRFLDVALRQLPWGRTETANLLFTRGVPRWIVMAHRDTKSQPVPTLVRSVALVVAGVAWVTLTGVAGVAVTTGAEVAPTFTRIVAGALAAAGAVLAVSRSGNESPGALDNGTGLAALLALAHRVPPEVAFLVTDGEELGLAGARAAAGRLPDVAGVINLDGLDDHGPVRIAEGRAGRHRATTGPLARALLEQARVLGLEAVRRPLPPFLLVDHQPLAAAGLPALTLLRGGWRTLRRVHRPEDRCERVSGEGAAAIATLVASTLAVLVEGEGDTLRPSERSGHSPAP